MPNLSDRKLRRTIIGTSLAMLCSTSPAYTQEATGSHLNSRAARSSIIQFNEPSALQNIEQLIHEGQREQAVAAAQLHYEKLAFAVQSHESFTDADRYFAANALCVALTTTRQYVDAIDACNTAIAIIPNRWSAINNRGTAKYASGDYGSALLDYNAALMVAPNDADVMATLQHNIALCESQIRKSQT